MFKKESLKLKLMSKRKLDSTENIIRAIEERHSNSQENNMK